MVPRVIRQNSGLCWFDLSYCWSYTFIKFLRFCERVASVLTEITIRLIEWWNSINATKRCKSDQLSNAEHNHDFSWEHDNLKRGVVREWWEKATESNRCSFMFAERIVSFQVVIRLALPSFNKELWREIDTRPTCYWFFIFSFPIDVVQFAVCKAASWNVSRGIFFPRRLCGG